MTTSGTSIGGKRDIVAGLLLEGRFKAVDEFLDGLDGDDIDDFADKAISDDDILTLSYLVGASYAFVYPDGMINALKNGSKRAFRYILFRNPEFMTESRYRDILIAFDSNENARDILSEVGFQIYPDED